MVPSRFADIRCEQRGAIAGVRSIEASRLIFKMPLSRAGRGSLAWLLSWTKLRMVSSLLAGLTGGGLCGEEPPPSEGSTYRPSGLVEPSGSRLGVGFAGELPRFDVQFPATKSEAAGEMVGKLGLSWMRDVWYGVPGEPDAPPVPPPLVSELREAKLAWFYGRLGLAPLGAFAGGVYGQFAGESDRKVSRAWPAMADALLQVQLPDRFEPLLLGLLRERIPGIVSLTNHLPSESSFLRPGLWESAIPLPAELQAVKKSWSDVRAFQGTDVAVVLRVVSWGLSGRESAHALLSVSFVVKGTLIQVRERTRGRSFYANYESAKQPFLAWAAEGGRPLRDELWRGIQSIANQVAQQLPVPPPLAQPGPFSGGL